MGELFSSPSLPPPMPMPEVKDPEEEARKKRLEEMERRRRGRAGTIATSPRGLLSLSDNSQNKKSLLGE